MHKILIVGEFSGFSKNLKIGLTQLGCEVKVINFRDGFKKIVGDEDDINLKPARNISICGKEIRGSNLIFRLFCNYRIRETLRRKIGKQKFDIIFIINSFFLYENSFLPKLGVEFEFLESILERDGSFFLSGCGDDPAYLMFHQDFKYSLYSDTGIPKTLLPSKRDISLFDKVLVRSKAVIPIDYTYSHCLKKYIKEREIGVVITSSIPLPYHVLSENYNYVEYGKIVITHGINRYDAKGSKYILEAMRKIGSMYSNIVEICILEKLPYVEYVKIMNKTNILIDQAKSYGAGMNAGIALAMGKIVMGGAEPESVKDLSACDTPIINITPNTEHIFLQIEKLILSTKEERLLLSEKSRKFAIDNLETKKVAQKYLNIFIN